MLIRKNKRINNSEPLRIWVWSLIGILILCVFSYGYLVRGAIVNIVVRQNMENQVSGLNSEVSNLEAEYIKVKNNVTLEQAMILGFVPVSQQKFVTRTDKGLSLSLLTAGN